MRRPEEALLKIIVNSGVDFTSSLPCEKIKDLLDLVRRSLFHVPLTREEEGVGICAGASLAGKRPAIFVQSSGMGNMMNALLSLTSFYELPLAVFVSRRGVYKEKIQAQIPMGLRLPAMLRGARVPFSLIDNPGDIGVIERKLHDVYRKNRIHAFLMSPEIWEGSECGTRNEECRHSLQCPPGIKRENHTNFPKDLRPELTRYEILEKISPSLDSKVVVCNLGFPSKELYHIRHQPSNFYMLGSMGMATPIGLGISLSTKKEVVVIDGDGSLLMNPGTLATAAYFAPQNLTIFAIDNCTYGSTGNQPTLTASCADLELIARGFGIRDTIKAASEEELVRIMKKSGGGFRFIHALAVAGNKDLPNIPIHHIEIKKSVQEYIKNRNER